MSSKEGKKKKTLKPTTKTTAPPPVDLKQKKAMELIASAAAPKKPVAQGFVFKVPKPDDVNDDEMVEGEVAEIEGPLDPVFPEDLAELEREAMEVDEDEKDTTNQKTKKEEAVEEEEEGEAVELGYTPGEVTVVQYCEECGTKARFTAKWSSWRAFCGGACEASFRKKIDSKVTNPGLDPINYAKGSFENAPKKRPSAAEATNEKPKNSSKKTK